MAFVCHMEKLQANDCGGIQVEDNRESQKTNEKNPNLDTELSYQNVHRQLTPEGYVDAERSNLVGLVKRMKEEVNKKRKENGKTKLRKDAVVCCSFLVSEDHEFFENMSREDTIRYFETAVEWFNKEFGNNVAEYSIHLDEYTPHMHMRLFPKTSEDALSAKSLFDRKGLQKTQRELPQYMREHGFDVGEPEHDFPVIHRNEAEQRIHALNQKIEKLETKLESKKEELKELMEDIKCWKDVKADYEYRVGELKEKISSLRGQIGSNNRKIEEQQEFLNQTQKSVNDANTSLQIILKNIEDSQEYSYRLQSGLKASKDVEGLLERIRPLAEVLEDEYARNIACDVRNSNITLQQRIRDADEILKRQSYHGKAVGKTIKKPNNSTPKGGGGDR